MKPQESLPKSENQRKKLMRTVPEGVPDVSACVLSPCSGAMKRRADAVGPATRQSSRLQKMQATAGAAVREPAPPEDPEQLLRARAARDARQRSRQLQAGTAAARDAAAGADGSDTVSDFGRPPQFGRIWANAAARTP